MPLGDLSRRSQNWEKVCACLAQGLIAGSLLGPPCETYTEARHNPPPQDANADPGNTIGRRRWPRPLRSCLRILGIDGLTAREHRQLEVGTSFLYQAFLVVAYHMTCGGFAMVEHPAAPRDESRASAWSSAIAELFRRSPSTTLHTLHQWRWGALSCKPTGFLVHAVPGFVASMYRHRDLSATYPTEEAIGCTESGEFRTSKLKEYPSHLCKGLATALLDQAKLDFQAGRSKSCASVPQELRDWIQDVDEISSPIHSHAHMMPDYQER